MTVIYFFANYCKKSKFNLKRKRGLHFPEYLLCPSLHTDIISFIYQNPISVDSYYCLPAGKTKKKRLYNFTSSYMKRLYDFPKVTQLL